MPEVDSAAIEDKAFAIGNSNYSDVKAAREKIGALLFELTEKGSANVASANDEKCEALPPVEESAVNNI